MGKRNPVVIGVPVPGPTQYVTREVHEHRAPTDQSVALLKEMEQAARDKVESAVRIEGNAFNCVVHVMREVVSAEIVAAAIFTLNGNQCRAEARVRDDALGRGVDSKVELIGRLRDEMARVIAWEMLRPALASFQE